MIKPIYHRLDPMWSRFPFPAKPYFAVEEHGEITKITTGRVYRTEPFLRVNCYIVGDTLIDTGVRSAGAQLLAQLRKRGVTKAFLTHHHEDHSGSAALLQREGISVRATPLTARILRRNLPIPFYQHLGWGKLDATELETFGDDVVIGGHRAEVVRAPGHAVDQVAFKVPALNALFCGDSFIHPRVRVFRGDEDFAETLRTCRRLAALQYDRLLCGHRPVWKGGREAMAEKVAWLEEIEHRVHAWRGRGMTIPAMERAFIDEFGATRFDLLTLGDVSFANMAHSVLYGPKTRQEMREFRMGVSTINP